MRKILFTALASLTLLFLVPHIIFAQSDFETTSNTEYKVVESGMTFVTSTISIKNTRSNFYPKKYIINLNSVIPQNVKVYETGRKLPFNVNQRDNITSLEINFENSTIGKNVTKIFVVTYQTDSLAKKSGEVWEVSIPKIENADFYKDYKVVLTTPMTWGNVAYISPEPKERKELLDRYIFNFTKESISNNQIIAGFGKFQAFNFALTYNLANTLNKPSTEEIALPPDTSTQIVFYDSLEPRPDSIALDEDGNWIASYSLKKNQKLKVLAKGATQIYQSPRTLDFLPLKPDSTLLASTSYWQSDDIVIKRLGTELKTAENIYNYIVKNLKYDYTRINPNYERLGSINALKNPDKALCMEFTDLFIALARAAGIPAREINGYAYSQNIKSEPLSLVADVLHSWPEYWNDIDKKWVPVDPTWAVTTGGTDFFNKFDLNHFAFVIHGVNSVKPYSPGSYKLGAYPEKDVNVTFGKLPDNKGPMIKTSYKLLGYFPIFSRKLNFVAENSGKSATYNANLSISGIEHPLNIKIKAILPFSKYETSVVVPYGILATKVQDSITISINGTETIISTNRTKVIIDQLILFFVFLILGIIMVLYGKTLKNYFTKVWKSISLNLKIHSQKLN